MIRMFPKAEIFATLDGLDLCACQCKKTFNSFFWSLNTFLLTHVNKITKSTQNQKTKKRSAESKGKKKLETLEGTIFS